jgi:ATP-dependent RNA helicase RhlE
MSEQKNSPSGDQQSKQSGRRGRRRRGGRSRKPDTNSNWDLSQFEVAPEEGKLRFHDLGLPLPLMRGIADLGFKYCSPIQARSLPFSLRAHDVVGKAQTGTGKTAAFLVTIITELLNHPVVEDEHYAGEARALIIAPTRELVMQIADDARALCKHTELHVHTLVGGMDYDKQKRHLSESQCDILVATPGRLLDFASSRDVYLDRVEILVLDEADRMLDMGFIRDIRKILALLPAKRQNLLFSATFSNEIRTLAEGLLDNPVQVEVAARNTSAENIKQSVYPVDQSQKTALLSKLVRDNSWDQVLVFTRTKHGANRLTQKLEKDGITAAAIHGNKSQGARTRALADFKAGEVRVLVATDIAARGLDIKQLPQVVNFELPNVPEDYVHRIGRTGRAGESGHALSLVSADEGKMLAGIERLIKKQLPRTEVEGFEPTNNLPLKPKAKADPSRARTRSSNGGGNGRPGGKPKSFGDKPGGRSGGRSQNGGGQRSRSAQRQSA